MVDYLEAIRRESARFGALVRCTPPGTSVPSCPGWSVSDLTWHLTEVQHFWASIAADLLQSPEDVETMERPPDAGLPDAFEAASARLNEAVSRRDPDDECWSWHDDGHSVGWVRRRQAHEALIHRVDAELAAQRPSSIDTALAVDGVDEVLRVMLDLDNLPEWATYEDEGVTARIEVEDGSASWSMRLGRFKGTSPNTGTAYDDPALRLMGRTPDPDVVLRGSGPDLDLWLWGRGPLESLSVEGSANVAALLRAAAADGTQ